VKRKIQKNQRKERKETKIKRNFGDNENFIKKPVFIFFPVFICPVALAVKDKPEAAGAI
jgi:hypothetical protein